MKKRITASVLLFLLILTGCGSTASRPTQAKAIEDALRQDTLSTEEPAKEESESETEAAADLSELYLLTEIDTAEGLLSLRRLSDEDEFSAAYSGATMFYDKYGTITSLASFEPGDVVTFLVSDGSVLSALRHSDAVFRWQDITDYTLDLDRMVFSYAGKNYRLKNTVPVYTNGKDTGLYSVDAGDSLDVTGMDKDILSMTVTTGLGTIELKNVGVFDGGWLNMDNSVYLEIAPDMEIPAAEGTHVLTVANDGWGDSTVVAVKRGQSVAVDLDALKGEGPKYCDLTVASNIEGASVYLDNQKKSLDEPISVRYGVHLLTVAADGYDVWQRRLVVNSETAQIEAMLTSVSGSSSASAESGSAADTAETPAEATPGSLAGSLAGSQSAGTSASAAQREAQQAAAETYLDTLTGMLDTLTGTSLSSDE